MSRDTSRDPRVSAGTDAHYLDAAYYDHLYLRRKEDVRFYAGLATALVEKQRKSQKRARPPRVLELGAGTGRVSIAMARAGASVVGVDRMPEMLDRAEARLAKEKADVRERTRLLRGDLRRVRLEERFDLVVSPFNVLMHLYERRDVEQALATVRAHLLPGARFVFDVLVPYPRELARDPTKTYRARPIIRPEDGKRYRYGESFDYDPITQVELITMVFEQQGRPETLFITPLAHRQFFPAELEALLHYNGFAIEARYGDFARGPLDRNSDSQVIVAKARR